MKITNQDVGWFNYLNNCGHNQYCYDDATNVESSWLERGLCDSDREPEQVLVTWDTVIMATLLTTQTISCTHPLKIFMNLKNFIISISFYFLKKYLSNKILIVRIMSRYDDGC